MSLENMLELRGEEGSRYLLKIGISKYLSIPRFEVISFNLKKVLY